MSKWTLTRKAQADFADILHYTTDTWGEEQADRYATLLLNGLDLIAEKPGLGRSDARLTPGLRRFGVGKHVVFYKRDGTGILISRILHRRMLPARSQFLDA